MERWLEWNTGGFVSVGAEKRAVSSKKRKRQDCFWIVYAKKNCEFIYVNMYLYILISIPPFRSQTTTFNKTYKQSK